MHNNVQNSILHNSQKLKISKGKMDIYKLWCIHQIAWKMNKLSILQLWMTLTNTELEQPHVKERTLHDSILQNSK